MRVGNGLTHGRPGLLRGIYIAASGLLAESARQDVIANNLANATTTGFKRSESTAHPFDSMLLHNMGQAGAPAIGTLTMGAEVDGIDDSRRLRRGQSESAIAGTRHQHT